METEMAPDATEDVSLPRPRLPLLLRMLAFAAFAVGLIGGLHLYIGTRLVTGAGLTGTWAAVGWGLLAFLFFSIPGGFIATRVLEGPLATLLYWIGHLWIGAFGLVLTGVVLGDAVRLACELILGAPDAAHALLWGRAQAGATLGLLGPALGYGYWASKRPRIEHVEIPIARLGKELDGLRIVQLSDVHISETLRAPWLRRVVERVNALEPDIVAITGDLIDGSVAALRSEVAPLRELSAREGVYYVTGNHEYYHGGPAWVAEVRRLSIQVLHNEHRVLQRGGDRLVLAGVTDLQGGDFDPSHRCQPDLAFAGAPAGVPRVLLAHQPRAAVLARGLDVDLQLSGHTHGGQIFPFMFFVRLQQPVVSGLKEIAGIRVYTSRGTGYWGPPLRVGAAPEITVLTLRAM
jgi:predicted MPP superfamily phosphohydrolase